MSTLEAVRVPTIAAIAGPCTGAGAAIANCCDIRIGSPSARYGIPIARTLGNCMSMANYTRAAALIGFARLKDLMMRARLMDAREMLECGLLSGWLRLLSGRPRKRCGVFEIDCCRRAPTPT